MARCLHEPCPAAYTVRRYRATASGWGMQALLALGFTFFQAEMKAHIANLLLQQCKSVTPPQPTRKRASAIDKASEMLSGIQEHSPEPLFAPLASLSLILPAESHA